MGVAGCAKRSRRLLSTAPPSQRSVRGRGRGRALQAGLRWKDDRRRARIALHAVAPAPRLVARVRHSGGRVGVGNYEPLTAEFVERHWPRLLQLPQMRDAQLALASLEGLEDYLDTYAEQHRAGASIEQDALRCFTRRVFEGAGEDFELLLERFEPAYRELQQGTATAAGELAVLALLRGI